VIFPNNLLDLVDAVLAAGTIKASAAISLCRCCSSRRSLAALAPHQTPLDQLIDAAQLTNSGINRVAGDRQRFWAAIKQFSRNRLPIDLQAELAVQRITVCNTPYPETFAAWRNFLIRVAAGVDPVLSPNIDRVRDGAAAVIEINRSKRIAFCEHIGDAISVPSLHGSECRLIVAPCAGIPGTGMPLRMRSHEWWLLPSTIW
jgi:hypothetical protein